MNEWQNCKGAQRHICSNHKQFGDAAVTEALWLVLQINFMNCFAKFNQIWVLQIMGRIATEFQDTEHHIHLHALVCRHQGIWMKRLLGQHYNSSGQRTNGLCWHIHSSETPCSSGRPPHVQTPSLSRKWEIWFKISTARTENNTTYTRDDYSVNIEQVP